MRQLRRQTQAAAFLLLAACLSLSQLPNLSFISRGINEDIHELRPQQPGEHGPEHGAPLSQVRDFNETQTVATTSRHQALNASNGTGVSIGRIQKENTTEYRYQHQQSPQHLDVDPFYHSFHPSKAVPGSLWLEEFSNKTLPGWIQYYLTWHQKMVPLLLKSNRRHRDFASRPKLFVVTCSSRKCGGTSDRLKPFPYYLRAAYMSKRILLVYWKFPAPIEKFMLPPVAGLDWRPPRGGWVERKIRAAVALRSGRNATQAILNSTELVFTTTLQTIGDGESFYEAETNETDDMTYKEVYPIIWRIAFTPSPPVAQRIRDALRQQQLVPKQYVSAHVRARYATLAPRDGVLQTLALNSLRCASELDPNLPTYVASDSSDVLRHARELADARRERVRSAGSYSWMRISKSNHNVTLPRVAWHESHPNPPLQLDDRNRVGKVEDYYDTFVDMYLLSLGKCVTHTIGGYGRWAALIGGMGDCILDQRVYSNDRRRCKWKEPTSISVEASSSLAGFDFDGMFIEPMSERNDTAATK